MNKEQACLLALNGKELSARHICQEIFIITQGKMRLEPQSLYPTLHSLEQKGLVVSRWGERCYKERGEARRHYYRLTQDGIKAIVPLTPTGLEEVVACHS